MPFTEVPSHLKKGRNCPCSGADGLKHFAYTLSGRKTQDSGLRTEVAFLLEFSAGRRIIRLMTRSLTILLLVALPLAALTGCTPPVAEDSGEPLALFLFAHRAGKLDGSVSGVPYGAEFKGTNVAVALTGEFMRYHIALSRDSIRNTPALTGDPFGKRLVHSVNLGVDVEILKVEITGGELDFSGLPAFGGSPRDQDVFIRPAVGLKLPWWVYGEYSWLKFNHMDERQAETYGAGVWFDEADLGIPAEISVGFRKVDHDQSRRSSRMLVAEGRVALHETVAIQLAYTLSDSSDPIVTFEDGSGQALGKFWSIDATVTVRIAPVILGVTGGVIDASATGSEYFVGGFIGFGL